MDFRLEQWINHPAGNHAFWDAVMIHAATWGKLIFVCLIGLWFLFGWFRGFSRDRQGALTALVAGIIGLLLNGVIAAIWSRPRPFIAHPDQVHLLAPHAADASFPSDHAVASFAIVAVMLAIRPRFGAVVGLFAILMIYARVYIGNHYPADVVAGALLGLLVGFATVRWLSPLMQRCSELIDRIIVMLHLPLPTTGDDPAIVTHHQSSTARTR